MDPKTNETPLLTKILRRFKGQCNKNKRCAKYSPADGPTDRQNNIEHVTGDSHASSPCGCHCVASCQKSLDGKHSSDSLVHSNVSVSKSCSDPQFSFPETFCPNSIVMHEGYSSLCELLDQFHRSSPSSATPTKPCKRDSQIQTDPLPNLPPLGSQEQILFINKNTSPAQSPKLYSSQIAEKQCPIPTETTQRESFDQTTSSGYSTCSFDRKTSASRTQSYPSLQQDAPLSPGMGNFRFDYRLRTSSCMLVTPTRSDLSQPSEYQHNIVSPDREHWDQESSSVSTAFCSRPSRTQSQSTPTHENHHDDFVAPDHRRRSLSDSYAFEAFRGAKRGEKVLKIRRNGSDGKNGSFSPGLISPHREDKLKITHAFEDKLSKKTAFSTFLDKMPKLSLLKRFKEKPLQYESVPDLSKFETPKTTRRLKSICRNVRSHEQLDQAGMRHCRACLVSSSKTQGSSPQHSDCGYIDPDTVSRNFSKKNALTLTKSVRKTMSINSIDTNVRNVTGGSVDTTPFHRSALHSPAPRSSSLLDVVGHQDSDEFYMTFDPDLNPLCPQTAAVMHAQSPVKSSESYETTPKNWRPIRQSNGIASDNKRLDQNGKESWYKRHGNAAEDDIDHTTTSKSCSSIMLPKHMWRQRSAINHDNRKYMPLPPLPTENKKQDIYQEIPCDTVFTPTRTSSPPCTPMPSRHPSTLEYTTTHRDFYPYPSYEDMHHVVYPQSKSRFGPLTHSPSSLTGNLTSPSRSPGHGNVFFSEGFTAKKLPVVSENGMRRRPDYISVHPTDVSEDGVGTREMDARSPPLHLGHRNLKRTLRVPNMPLRHTKYQGYHSSSSVEEKKCDGREAASRGKIMIPPIFLQQ